MQSVHQFRVQGWGDQGELGARQVYPGPGKVGDPADVIDVVMGEHDVGDRSWVDAEPGQLPDRRFGRIEGRPRVRQEARTQPAYRVAQIGGAEAGVDQRPTGTGLHQQASSVVATLDAPPAAHCPYGFDPA